MEKQSNRFAKKRKTHDRIIDAYRLATDFLGLLDTLVSLCQPEVNQKNKRERAAELHDCYIKLIHAHSLAWDAAWIVEEWLTRAHIRIASAFKRKSHLLSHGAMHDTNYHQFILDACSQHFIEFKKASNDLSREPTVAEVSTRIDDISDDLRDSFPTKTYLRQLSQLKAEAFAATGIWEESIRTDEDEDFDSSASQVGAARRPEPLKPVRLRGRPPEEARDKKWFEEMRDGIKAQRWKSESEYIEWRVDEEHKVSAKKGKVGIKRDAIEVAIKRGRGYSESEKTNQ